MKYSFVIAALVGAMTQVDLAEATAVSRHHRRHHHHQFVQDDDKAEEGKDVEQAKKEETAMKEVKKEVAKKNEEEAVKTPKEKKAEAAAKKKEEEEEQSKAEAKVVKEFKRHWKIQRLVGSPALIRLSGLFSVVAMTFIVPLLIQSATPNRSFPT